MSVLCWNADLKCWQWFWQNARAVSVNATVQSSVMLITDASAEIDPGLLNDAIEKHLPYHLEITSLNPNDATTIHDSSGSSREQNWSVSLRVTDSLLCQLQQHWQIIGICELMHIGVCQPVRSNVQLFEKVLLREACVSYYCTY